jgi:S1-C subfamily serine protease
MVLSCFLAFSSLAWEILPAFANKASTRKITDKILSASVGVFDKGACGGTLIAAREVLTAAHCVGNTPSQIIVSSDNGDKVSVIAVKRNIPRDLAILILMAPLPETIPATLSLDISQGDLIFVVGCPKGICSFVTSGRLSQFGNFPTEDKSTDERYGTANEQHLLSDAWGFPGMSGGGWFDEDGALIGVTVVIFVLEDMHSGPHYVLGAVGPEAISEWLTTGK